MRVCRTPELAEDPVEVVGAAHRDRQDVFAVGRPRCLDRRDSHEPHEVGADWGSDRDQEATAIGGIDRRGHDDRRIGVVVAVLGGLRPGARERKVGAIRQHDRASEGGRVGSALNPKRAGPIPGDVDDDRAEPHEEEDRKRKQGDHPDRATRDASRARPPEPRTSERRGPAAARWGLAAVRCATWLAPSSPWGSRP